MTTNKEEAVSEKLGCRYCEGEPEPGWIEMPNNGPIVACPICNNEDDYTRAERKRDLQRRAALQSEGKE